MKIVTRAEWGWIPGTPVRTDVNPLGVTWHYPGPGRFRFDDHARCIEQVRAWDRMHRARGSNGLEYCGVGCQHRYFFEARSTWDRMIARPGSNGTAAANSIRVAYQFMAGTLDAPPNDTEVGWMAEVTARARSQGAGSIVDGHRDHYATACPGDALYRRLPDIRRIADEGPDDMPLTDEDVARIADAVWQRIVGKDLSGTDRSAAWMLTGARNNAFQAAKGAPTQPQPEPEPCDGYTVVKGDTLGKIASAHGISLADLLALNPQITDPNRIEVGDCIVVPKATTAT